MKFLKSTLVTLLIIVLAWLMLERMGEGVPKPTYTVPAVGKIYYTEGKLLWWGLQRDYVRVDSINNGMVNYSSPCGQAGTPLDIEHFREFFPFQAR